MPIITDERNKRRAKVWLLGLLAAPWFIGLGVFLFTLIWPLNLWVGRYHLAAGLTWEDFISAGHPPQGILWRQGAMDGTWGFWFSWRTGQPWYYVSYLDLGPSFATSSTPAER